MKAAGAPVPVDITRLWCKDTVVPWDARCADVHIFRCALPSPPALTLKQQVAVGIIVAVCCVALLIAANICMAHANKMRRYYMRAKTRLQGSPKHGRLSLVVTDIEGYSGEYFTLAGHTHIKIAQLQTQNGFGCSYQYAQGIGAKPILCLSGPSFCTMPLVVGL